MAKISNSASFKGAFDHEEMTISEYNKQTEGFDVYDLAEYLQRFDGKEISLTIKEELPVETMQNNNFGEEEE